MQHTFEVGEGIKAGFAMITAHAARPYAAKRQPRFSGM